MAKTKLPTYTYANVTIPNGGYTIGNLNTNGAGITYATGTGASQWSTATMASVGQVKITENDITIGNVSLKDTLQAIQDRLAILVPDPKRLEEFAALKQAYEHYKTLEALCCPTENKDKK
jgi:hypothetical protein